MTILAQNFRIIAAFLIAALIGFLSSLGLSGAAVAQQTPQPGRQQLAEDNWLTWMFPTLRAVFGSGAGSGAGRSGA